MADIIKEKKVLVTGAGGSIGSELCRSLKSASQILLLGHSEQPIYDINQQIPGSIPILGDIRSLERMRQVFYEYEPDIVFHAAAIKHLPLAQQYPMEAVLTNVIGTRNVAIASQMIGASMVMISTDKAVYPTCIMGKTKRIAELYCGLMPNTTVIRLGNVLESSGSVIPLFKRQISEGGPVTVTHPDMTRYFMETKEAVNLAISSLDAPGNLHVLKMRKRRIVDIAHELIGEQKIWIKFTGLREGEKLDEQLLYESEYISNETDTLYCADIDKRDSMQLNKQITALEQRNLSILEVFDYG